MIIGIRLEEYRLTKNYPRCFSEEECLGRGLGLENADINCGGRLVLARLKCGEKTQTAITIEG